jgi:hypothetical protein
MSITKTMIVVQPNMMDSHQQVEKIINLIVFKLKARLIFESQLFDEIRPKL